MKTIEQWEAEAMRLADEYGRLKSEEGLADGAFDALGRRRFREEAQEALAALSAHLATHPGRQGEGIYEQRLRAVLSVVQRYLPPDGLAPKDAMSEIVGLVDPWPDLSAQPGRQGEWQPIESAPKDGTRIAIKFKSGNEKEANWRTTYGGEWHVDSFEFLPWADQHTITHWKTLPKEPTHD